MKPANFIRSRWAKAAIVLGIASCAGAIFALSRSQTAGAVAPPFETVQTYLAQYDYVQTSLAQPSTSAAITPQQAEDTALAHFGAPGMSGVTATLTTATNTAYCRPQADGTCAPVISNRPVWVVLVPNQQVPIYGGGPDAPQQASAYTATVAVLIDANTGTYLEAAAIPSS